MRKTKEDMMQTRENILLAAFRCFYQNGLEITSLEEIAKQANVTRGAIYWHFKDKQALYRAVADMALERGDVSTFYLRLPQDLPLPELLTEILWLALNDNAYVDFVFKALCLTDRKPEFADVFQKIRDIKLRLIDFFHNRIIQFSREKNIPCSDPLRLAHALYYLFEGMLITKNISLGIQISHEDVAAHIELLLHKMLQDTPAS